MGTVARNGLLRTSQVVSAFNASAEKQKQPPEVFYSKDVLKNFAKFTRKHLYQSLLSDS